MKKWREQVKCKSKQECGRNGVKSKNSKWCEKVEKKKQYKKISHEC